MVFHFKTEKWSNKAQSIKPRISVYNVYRYTIAADIRATHEIQQRVCKTADKGAMWKSSTF